jgi:hypothetical protein
MSAYDNISWAALRAYCCRQGGAGFTSINQIVMQVVGSSLTGLHMCAYTQTILGNACKAASAVQLDNLFCNLLTLLQALLPLQALVAIARIHGMQSQFALDLQLPELLSETQWDWKTLLVTPCAPALHWNV